MSSAWEMNETINAARDTLATMDGLRSCFSIPDDVDAGLVDLSALPAMSVGMAILEEMEWRRHTSGRGLWFWHLELFLFLQLGEMQTELQAAHAMKLHSGWFKKVASKLMRNMTLGVPQTAVGQRVEDGRVYRPRIGHIVWSEVATYWGIRFIVPVSQYFVQTTSRSEAE